MGAVIRRSACAALALALGAVSSACYRPEPGACLLACAEGDLCPPGLTCMGDSFCHRPGEAPTCGADASIDAGAAAVTAIAAGDRHACAIRAGRVYCWGDNRRLQLGTAAPVRRRATAVEIDEQTTGWTAIASGRNHTCGVRDGAVRCWGEADNRQIGAPVSTSTPTQVSGPSGPLAGATAVCAGDVHACAIVEGGGQVMCWGADSSGQLGDGSPMTTRALAQPVIEPVDAGAWTALACGATHTCAIRGGRAYCWGSNSSGQLGRTSGATDQPAMPLVNLTAPSQIVAGLQHACAVDGGILKCWGSYDNSSFTTPAVFMVAGLQPSAVTVASAGGQGICGSRGSATYCVGTDQDGERGDGSFVYQGGLANPVQGLQAVTALASGSGFHCAIAGDAVRCWGRNSDGQLGTGTHATGFRPRQVPGQWQAVSAGVEATCAIDAGGAVRCWGHNPAGRLIPGNADLSIDTPTAVPGLGAVDRIALATAHACATETTTGRVRCWGDALYGRIGNGSTTSASVPPYTVPYTGTTPMTGATALAVSDHATMAGAVGASPALYGWGDNTNHRIGLGSPTQFATAGVVDAQAWQRLALGQTFGCGTRSGTLLCWGDDSRGQQGNGAATAEVVAPTAVTGLVVTVAELAASGTGAHACAVSSGGELYCWGDNVNRQAGPVATDTIDTPSPIDTLVTWSAVSAGTASTGAIKTDGGLYCWGRDEGAYQQCGLDRDSGNAYVEFPTLMGGDFASVSLGDKHGCATATGQRLFCWGESRHGAAGIAGARYHALPQPVVFP